MNPSASAPASTAARASSRLVIPQILTRTFIVAGIISAQARPLGHFFLGGGDVRRSRACRPLSRLGIGANKHIGCGSQAFSGLVLRHSAVESGCVNYSA